MVPLGKKGLRDSYKPNRWCWGFKASVRINASDWGYRKMKGGADYSARILCLFLMSCPSVS